MELAILYVVMMLDTWCTMFDDTEEKFDKEWAS
jgi:hypothetical protein